MRFLVDAQLPPALARYFIDKGHQAEHVFDVALAQAPDGAIWSHALSANAVIVTKDEDFAARRVVVREGPSILWVRLGNTRTAHIISRIDSHLPELLRLLELGESIVEIV